MSEVCHKSKKAKYVKIANPRVGQSTHMKVNRARRLVAEGQARFDGVGRVELFYYDENVLERKRNGRSLEIVEHYSGLDAFPGRPVLQFPSAVLRTRSYRGPLVPPLRASSL